MRRRTILLWLLGASAPAFGEIIDRVAVSVDEQVITLSRIMEEIKVTALLNGSPAPASGPERRVTADRLIEQILMSREMEIARYPASTAADIATALQDVKSRFASEAAFRLALAARSITEKQLEDALLRQASLLRFIELRFRPEVEVSEADAQQYYETVFLPEARRRGIKPDPEFDDVRAQCEEAVAAQLVDKRVEAWLKEARARARIVYQEEAFQ